MLPTKMVKSELHLIKGKMQKKKKEKRNATQNDENCKKNKKKFSPRKHFHFPHKMLGTNIPIMFRACLDLP